jgi:hypothetical protein
MATITPFLTAALPAPPHNVDNGPMALAIDRAVYAVAPRIGVGNGSTLLEQLIDVAKDDESEVIEASVKKLRKVLGKARTTKAQSVRVGAKSTAAGDLEIDRCADRCAKAIKLRLDAWPLAVDDERARRAEEHLRLLFPTGLQFTQASFATQDAEMRRMLDEMKQPELAASLDALVGPEFIQAFGKAAKAYSAMVKAMGHAVAGEVNQRAMVIEMQTAIVQHVSRVLGELEDDDPASVERVRGLLAPIDNFRARAGQGGGGGGTQEGEDGEGEDGKGGAGGAAPPSTSP